MGHCGEAKKLTENSGRKKNKNTSRLLSTVSPPSSSLLWATNLVWVPRWIYREAGPQRCPPEIPIWLNCLSLLRPDRTAAGGAWMKTTLIWSSPWPSPLKHKSGVDSGDYGDGLWCQNSKFKDVLWKINKYIRLIRVRTWGGRFLIVSLLQDRKRGPHAVTPVGHRTLVGLCWLKRHGFNGRDRQTESLGKEKKEQGKDGENCVFDRIVACTGSW